MVAPLRRVLAAAFPILSLLPVAAAAQPAVPAAGPAPAAVPSAGAAPPDIVVTPNRTEQPIQRAGSAISVITAEDIQKSSARSVGDLLQQVPGVSVTQSGGAGRVETARIRGGDVRHTLVLVDGIRVNDPSTTGREFDFSAIVLADIERIEILRGPQSALYGSDAMGGVINIITRRGRTGHRATLEASYGSYNTKETRGGVSGGNGRAYYSLGFAGVETDGFSAYGYRIPRIERRLPPLEADGATRLGVTGRVGVHLDEATTIEAGGTLNRNKAAYDSAFGAFPDGPSRATSALNGGYARLIHNGFGGALRSTVTVFGNETDRKLRDYFTFGPGPLDYFHTDRRFQGNRIGGEYQGDLKLGPSGVLTFGARVERETAAGSDQAVFPVPGPAVRSFRGEQETRSAFLLYQHSFGDRLHLSLGGRVDDVAQSDRFVTGRATLAYEIWETGTKLRGSLGTGAKAPSLYQLHSAFGTAGLESEHSVGVDVGIDQRLFDDALRLSASAFHNRYRNLIDFTTDTGICTPGQAFGCYFNVARARMQGIELEAEARVNPAFRIRGAYTYLQAVDLETGLRLTRRPEHQAFLGVAISPAPHWSVEPRLVYVGERFSSIDETNRLAAYARLDVLAEYRVNETVALFARAENVTDTRYEEVRDYGTPGRSLYGGIRVTW
ncbi:MAG TPA: TonB-dependent receptor [Microvirga sp.]|nr:TonB-dependent receptor [Microvirga sp.]